MFNNEKEYINATKHSRVNTYKEKAPMQNKLIIINLFMAGVLLMGGFIYINNNQIDFFEQDTHKVAVLGVSKVVDDATGISDEEFMKILQVTETDTTVNSTDKASHEELTNSMKVLMLESNIKSQSSYAEAIARELEDKSTFKGRTIIVKQGDTLSSLSEKFYGNPMEFSRIIESNDDLSNSSYLLRVGQTIKIPL